MKLKLTKGGISESYILLDNEPEKPYLKVMYGNNIFFLKLAPIGTSKFKFNNLYPVVEETGGGDLPIVIPDPVTNIRTGELTQRTAEIMWDAPTNTVIDEYKASVDSKVIQGKETRAFFEGLNRGTLYTCSVRASNSAGVSEESRLMFRTTRAYEPILEVFAMRKEDIKTKDYKITKEYVVFMPPGSYYIECDKDVDIIEVD